MTDMLIIKNGAFQANIILDKLPELPLENIKKLFSLMFKAPWDNRDTIETLGDRIRSQIEDAKYLKGAMARLYAAGYKVPRSKSRHDPESVEQRKKNEQLTKDLNSSNTRLKKWEAILTLYEKEK